ncbi:MAG: hypothetical protein VB022_01865 [Rikenellaceae bacterium]|nr:hypothetical protein [Rikenellaceae bacterium]
MNISFNKKTEGGILINVLMRSDNVKVSALEGGKGVTDSTLTNSFRIDKKQNSRFMTEGKKGSALALILCKHFIEFCNGTISISGNKGKGCLVMSRILVQESSCP